MKKSKSTLEAERSTESFPTPAPSCDPVPMRWPAESRRLGRPIPKRRLTYSEKLLDSRWQKKRLELLESAGWKCQFGGCVNENGNPTLHVHHKVYLRGLNPWEYEDWAYSVLCDECHEIAQSQMEQSHCLLAKHQTLRAILALVGGLDADSQSVFLGDLFLLIEWSMVSSGEINMPFFNSLSDFLTHVFISGTNRGAASARDSKEPQ